MSKMIAMEGLRYGKLIIASRAGSVNGKARWNCECDCGKFTIVTGAHLREGSVVSCGCKRDASQYGNF